MKYFVRKKKDNSLLIFISAIAATLAVIGVILKVLNFLRTFKKNTDRFIMLSNSEIDFDGEVFEDECIAVVSSKTKIDLTDAIPSDNPMNLCLKCKYANTDVVVPSDWNVKVQGNTTKSNIVNEVVFDKENFDAPLLFINYVTESSSLRIYSDNKKIEE